MSDRRLVLVERLFLAEEPQHSRCIGKCSMIISLLIGVGLAVVLTSVARIDGWNRRCSVVQDTDEISMALRNVLSAKVQHTPHQLRNAFQLASPVGVQQAAWLSSAKHFGMPTAAVASATVATTGDKVEESSQLQSPPPGLEEDSHFQLDESVAVWKNFQRYGSVPATDNLGEASSIASSIATRGEKGREYALVHGLRTGYFTVNSVLGLLASGVVNQVRGTQSGEEDLRDMGMQGGEVASNGVSVVSRMLLEAAMCFQQDYRAVDEGLYKLPWDMHTPGHRQLTPQYAAQQTGRLLNEIAGTVRNIGIWLDSPLYPDYYKNNFHYQIDGWMSSRSAQVYETSTETLFLGRQDAMQRLSLLPLHNLAATNGGAPRILEVACGTGRFATFIRDNHPAAHFTAVDLSPFYLEAARENDEYWRKTRYPNEQTRPPPATFVQAAAEKLPFEDGSFDAVVCVYLFHEMPEAARAAAAAEMARVVAPGGIVILTDSLQHGDRPAMDNGLGSFARLNEPHYKNYIDTYIPALFTSSGLTCDRKWVESVTKCLSFRKHADESGKKESTPSQTGVAPDAHVLTAETVA